MVDFSQLKALEIDGSKLREFKFDQLDGSPSIWCLPASEENKSYMNAALRLSAQKNKGGFRRNKRTTTDQIKTARDDDKDLHAKYCAKKWERVKDASGQDVPFTEENCRDFLGALPDWIYDEFRTWVGEATNWLEADDLGERSRPGSSGNSGTSETASQ